MSEKKAGCNYSNFIINQPNKKERLLALSYSAFICGSKLAQIHKAGCHPAALTGCGGRVKYRCRNSGKV